MRLRKAELQTPEDWTTRVLSQVFVEDVRCFTARVLPWPPGFD
ncbi:MAG TPA: hypothetical protein VF754_01880 [Pyrinomonadaceae bacterium]